ncbi:hypothetical protein IAD21_03566 [Abditibacteriota bacterium]|nr:hypothetical protein IAD21_03566 [Abditibacteriota bacterium]
MKNEPLLPPLASPHGAGTFDFQEQQQPDSIRVIVALQFAAVCRYAMLEWFTPLVTGLLLGCPFLMSLVVFPTEVRRSGIVAWLLVFLLLFVVLVVLSAPLPLFIRLCSRRRFDIQISAAGLGKRYSRRNIFFPWSKFFWIIERGGDIWLASLMDGCFIPRECFASPEESHEFATIVRELKRTQGAAWHPEWNGRVFGVQTEGGDALSIPR